MDAAAKSKVLDAWTADLETIGFFETVRVAVGRADHEAHHLAAPDRPPAPGRNLSNEVRAELREALGRDLVAAAVLRGDFLLRSGARSSYYIDKYLFTTNPDLLARITAELVARLPARTQALAGPVLGAIPLVTALSLSTRLPMLIVRVEKPKEHGTSRQIEGRLQAPMEEALELCSANLQSLAALLLAVPCDSLKSLSLPNTTITMAQTVAAGQFAEGGRGGRGPHTRKDERGQDPDCWTAVHRDSPLAMRAFHTSVLRG